MDEIDIAKIEYASWLEDTLREMIDLKPISICLAAIFDDGNVETCYYNATVQDKAIIAHNVYTDAILETIANNQNEEEDECSDS